MEGVVGFVDNQQAARCINGLGDATQLVIAQCRAGRLIGVGENDQVRFQSLHRCADFRHIDRAILAIGNLFDLSLEDLAVDRGHRVRRAGGDHVAPWFEECSGTACAERRRNRWSGKPGSSRRPPAWQERAPARRHRDSDTSFPAAAGRRSAATRPAERDRHAHCGRDRAGPHAPPLSGESDRSPAGVL